MPATTASGSTTMPRYNYACTTCGPFEAWASIGASGEPAECPACGGMSDRALAAPFIASAGHKQAAALICGMGACGMCATPPAD
jgi:putative FmdB family regulatory protein